LSAYISKLLTIPNHSEEIEFHLNSHRKQDCWFKLYSSSRGNGDKVVGILQDITKLHHFRKKLAQVDTVLACTTEGVVFLNNRKLDCANDAFYAITQYQAHELENQELAFLTPGYLGANRYNQIWQDVEGNQQWKGEIEAFKKNGEKFTIQLMINKINLNAYEHHQSILMLSDISASNVSDD